MNKMSVDQAVAGARKGAKAKRAAATMALIAVSMLPMVAFASDTGGDDLGLGELLEWLRGLLMGPLGKIGALCSFAVGMIAGIATGRFLAMLTGIGFAVAFYYGPDIILRVFGASL